MYHTGTHEQAACVCGRKYNQTISLVEHIHIDASGPDAERRVWEGRHCISKKFSMKRRRAKRKTRTALEDAHTIWFWFCLSRSSRRRGCHRHRRRRLWQGKIHFCRVRARSKNTGKHKISQHNNFPGMHFIQSSVNYFKFTSDYAVFHSVSLFLSLSVSSPSSFFILAGSHGTCSFRARWSNLICLVLLLVQPCSHRTIPPLFPLSPFHPSGVVVLYTQIYSFNKLSPWLFIYLAHFFTHFPSHRAHTQTLLWNKLLLLIALWLGGGRVCVWTCFAPRTLAQTSEQMLGGNLIHYALSNRLPNRQARKG